MSKPKPTEHVRATVYLACGGHVEVNGDLYVAPGTPDAEVAEYIRHRADYNPEHPLDITDIAITRQSI